MNVNKESEARGNRRPAWLRRSVPWGVALVLVIALALMLHGHADARAAVACAGSSWHAV